MPAAIHSTLANRPTSRNRRRRPGCGATGSHIRDSAAHPPIEPIGDLQAIGFGDGCGGLPAGVFTGNGMNGRKASAPAWSFSAADSVEGWCLITRLSCTTKV